MLQVKAKLIYNKRVAAKNGDYLLCALQAPEIAHRAHPGQFITIRLSNGLAPLLRRPLSIHRIKGGSLEILYEVVGEGTKILAQKKPGEYLDIIGPLGNGFNLSPHTRTPAHRQTIIVAGGMGVAPLLFLAEKLTTHNSQPTTVLLGAKTKGQILCEKEFKKLGCDVKIATDDSSRGFKGRVTDLFKSILLTTRNPQLTTIYACGPRPMLKEISRISQEYNIPAQASLEEHMACGFGACLGCVVKTSEGYKRVCSEGPVFMADEIAWDDK